ncbi:MAG: T9SS type A sorting domain-containing protein [Bacteroidales bacterium]|nr:T9SS type A sorting domain-containing protein [Bacteroidales bacterium]
MKTKKRYTSLMVGAIALLLAGSSVIKAQQSMNTTSGQASGIGGTVSYTVGQVVYVISNGTTGSASPGIQQSYEITVTTGLEKMLGIDIVSLAYPNPARDNLYLITDCKSLISLSYQLFDSSGKLLESNVVQDIKTRIPISDLDPATYFIEISSKGNVINVFKIIKY